MPTPLDEEVVANAAELFGLLSAPTRLRIVCALIDGEKNVTELTAQVAVSQTNVSQHLGMLYRSGVLGRRRDGSQVFYCVSNDQVRSLCRTLLGRDESPLLVARRPRRAPTPA